MKSRAMSEEEEEEEEERHHLGRHRTDRHVSNDQMVVMMTTVTDRGDAGDAGNPEGPMMWPRVTPIRSGVELIYHKKHSNVTIVFADIVGWTEMWSVLPNESLLFILQEYFSILDELTEKVGVYKVETVGDAYVACCNFDGKDAHHAMSALVMAECIIRTAESILVPQWSHSTSTDGDSTTSIDHEHDKIITSSSDLDDPPHHHHHQQQQQQQKPPVPAYVPLQVRVGIHSGSVTSVVVGSKRKVLTLVGDAMNTASRMETYARPGTARISEAAFCWLPRAIQVLCRSETIHVKGKGRMRTFEYVPDGTNAAVAVGRLKSPR